MSSNSSSSDGQNVVSINITNMNFSTIKITGNHVRINVVNMNNSFVEIIGSKIDTNAVINGIIKFPAIFTINYNKLTILKTSCRDCHWDEAWRSSCWPTSHSWRQETSWCQNWVQKILQNGLVVLGCTNESEQLQPKKIWPARFEFWKIVEKKITI